jgi:predicted dehydrogenase
MIAAAQKSGKLLTIYQVLRFDARFIALKEILESGKLGPLYLVRLAGYGFTRRRDWQTLKKFGGGQLNNWGAQPLPTVVALGKYGTLVESAGVFKIM